MTGLEAFCIFWVFFTLASTFFIKIYLIYLIKVSSKKIRERLNGADLTLPNKATHMNGLTEIKCSDVFSFEVC